ncbi:rsc complex subunit rsc9 [Neofusicoccum parvum]|nr:rsc complex subunit rsc9 [Neofusicoccum parvum]
MAPARPREPSIERTSEYDDFMNKLEEYHAKRGTTLDREPKVGQRHLDLFRLYSRVCEEGGYDKVSDTKNNKLAWRRIAAEFIPSNLNPTTQAFIVKSHYYKNLAAYEITHFHGKEPPPKEILEDVSAKGGDLLTRTKENFFAASSRELESLTNGRDSDESEEEGQKTPKEDKMDIDEAPGSSYSQSNGSYGAGGNSMSIIANYEPKPVVPSNVKPVTTPSNNPEHFRSLRSRMASRYARPPQQNKGMMLPGTGFTGPNIYIRALLALQSGSVEEQAYALHHLVKISHERGDKYRFDGFPGLAEALIDRLLEVSTLFYGIRWEISYIEDESLQRNDTLNAISGTADLLQKIRSHPLLDFTDDVQTKEFSEALGRVNEAGLVIRNLVMLDANAHYVAQLPLVQDFITIALNLPARSSVIELKHYALEIAEQLSRYWMLDSDHHLYQTLLAQLNSRDRGTIITALRALSRIAMNANPRYELTNVPTDVIQHVCEWLLVEDEHLREACLDFLYLYTATAENVETLTQYTDVEALVKQLVRLLLYNAQTIRIPVQSKAPGKPATTIFVASFNAREHGTTANSGGGEECGEFVKEPKQIWEHVLSTHLGLSKDSNGKWQIEEPATNGVSEENGSSGLQTKTYDCRWAGCLHFARAGEKPTVFEVGKHVQTHLPDSSDKSQMRNQHNQSNNSALENSASTQQHQYYGAFAAFRGNAGREQASEIRWLNTAMDERSVAQSLSGASSMVLRNLARRLGAVPTQSGKQANGDTDMDVEETSWVRKVFAPVKDDLFFVMAHNQSLKEGIYDLMREISSAGA